MVLKERNCSINISSNFTIAISWRGDLWQRWERGCLAEKPRTAGRLDQLLKSVLTVGRVTLCKWHGELQIYPLSLAVIKNLLLFHRSKAVLPALQIQQKIEMFSLCFLLLELYVLLLVHTGQLCWWCAKPTLCSWSLSVEWFEYL